MPGALSFAEIHRVNGDVEPIRSKGVVRCVKGDRLVLQSAGGGGYGDPRARSRSAIATDIADGKVTRTQAEQSYMNS